MKGNWQNADWPNFRYDAGCLVELEQKFLRSAGEVIDAARHFNDDDSNQLRIELLSHEAVKTSEIEGEFLDRISVQSSLRQQFGLNTDDRQIHPKSGASPR